MSERDLTAICRCGHARRFHQRGTIWQGYETTCLKATHMGEYADTGCVFFEPAREVVTLRRLPNGRFAKATA